MKGFLDDAFQTWKHTLKAGATDGLGAAGSAFSKGFSEASGLGKITTATAGWQGYRKLRDPDHNVPFVPFL